MQKTHFFVSVKSNNLGIGKVIGYEPDGQQAVVEYFDSPTTIERKQVRCPLGDIQPVPSLEEQTRVYFYNRIDSLWKMGRIEGHIDELCFILLPNREQAKIPQEEVYVRWNLPLSDPTEHLKAGLTESPYLQQRRSHLVSHLIRQRAVARGMTALLSAPVSLERHQLEVVSKVLGDPVQRYLLADEVGLGKTIEAGMIARQHILDNPEDHNVTVLVPAALVQQWRSELRCRCNIGDEFLHQVEVVSYEDFLSNKDQKTDLLIIDEAHQIARPEHRELYSKLCKISHPSRCPKLLLLSATPVRGNENGFLSLLHLLDPSIYRLEGIDEFRLRVAKRQELANLFATLTDDQDDYFLEQAVIDAKSLFSGDARLQNLTGELLSLMTVGEPPAKQTRSRLIGELRSYLADTYRLDRRLLRNRRSGSIEGLLPGRAGLRQVPCGEGEKRTAEQFVEVWRERAAKMCGKMDHLDDAEWPHATELFCGFLEASWSSPSRFLELVEQRKEAIENPRRKLESLSFDGELALLKDVLEQAEAVEDEHDAVIDSICQAVLEEAKKFDRVVVIGSDTGTANTIFRRLNLRTLISLSRCAPDDELAAAWTKPGILVCDSQSEEGLNLQGGKVCLVHADLPLSPNRIEQRVGRLDRIGIGYAVPSVAFVPEGSDYLQGWVRVLEQGWQLFDRSIASLQYLVQDEMQSLRRRLFAEGSSAFGQTLETLAGESGRIQEELRAIRNQDELDALGEATSGAEQLIDKIEMYELEANEFSHSMNEWLQDVLHFFRVGEDDKDDNVWRYHYRSGGRGQQTLVGKSVFQQWFQSAVDPEPIHSEFRPPFSWPMTGHRETARRRHVGVARLGHSWVDAVNAHLRWDDRGTCSAVWRWDAGTESTQTYFQFIAILEANPDVLKAWCEENDWAHPVTVGRIADSVFPPVIVPLWMGVDLIPPSSELKIMLERGYEKSAGDVNVSGVRWLAVFQRLGISNQEWADTCVSVRDAAHRQVMEEHQVVDLIASKVALHDQRYQEVAQQLRHRLDIAAPGSSEEIQVQRDLTRATQLHGAIRESILQARIRFDSVSATFLSPERPE